MGETFSEGRESVTDEERSGRPATSRTEENIVKVRQIVPENRQLTVRSIAVQVNIDRETVRKILTEDLDIIQCSVSQTFCLWPTFELDISVCPPTIHRHCCL